MLDRFFHLKEYNTNVKTEFLAGVTTFMTMAYIIFVNPAILSSPFGAKMDFAGVMAATCIASALATLVMGLCARYPIAMAPGMGLNAFFSFTLCGAMKIPWEIALGIVFISAVLCFTLLSIFKVREMIMDAVPKSLKLATAVGIGLFIAFIGLKEAGIVVQDPNTLVTLGHFSVQDPNNVGQFLPNKPMLLALGGLLFTLILVARNVYGALLWGILATGALGLLCGVVQYQGIVSTPQFSGTFGKLDIMGALRWEYAAAIITLIFVDTFDTTGTLIGVGEKAGFLKDGKLERATPALLSDAAGSIIGAVCGTSNTTSYIESAAGVSAGGRTGLCNVFTALLFIAALFFAPLAQMLGGGFKVAEGVYLYPVTAPALIIVGFLMMTCISKIAWDDYTEALPAFLTVLMMPLTFSISHGLGIGFISYPLLKLAAGKGKEVSWLVYLLAVAFILYFAVLYH
jgi:AGZA family xanthine/uracil permease-like MFS transporter